MKRFAWEIPLVAILCTGVGLAVGKLVLGGAEHAAADEHGDEHADEHGPHLSEATLTNLGVEVAPIELTRFVRRMRVAATVVDTPRTELPVFAPMGGRVDRIDVVEGMVTGPGEPLASLVREALPRPELTLTAEVLRPAQERLHETVLELRRALRAAWSGRRCCSSARRVAATPSPGSPSRPRSC